MTLMWLAFAVLLLLALWLLVTPLRRAAALYDAQHEFEVTDRTAEQNVAIYQRRLASLEAAFERGEIDRARYAEDRLELDRSLLEDTESLVQRPLQAPATGRLVVPVIAVAVIVAAVLWYQQHGAEGDLALFDTFQHSESLPELMEGLEQQAQSQPQNANVWALLFPIYRDSGQGEAALHALNNLIGIEGRDPSLLAQKAQLKFFMAERNITDEVQALIDETLRGNPSEPTILAMLGVHAFDNSEFEAAIDHWRRAIAGMGESGTAQALREGIQIAQQRLGIAPDAAEALAATGPGVTLRLSLDPSLSERLPASASVFVVARDTAGELPPLAIQRTTLGELPLTLTLNDSHAMAPSARLSQVAQAHLVARVSESGQATPQPGDLMGRLENVTVGSDEPLSLVIDRVVE